MEVFFPIYAGDKEGSFEPVGAIVYNEFLLNGITYFNSINRGGFFGTKMPMVMRDLIIARDPFEFCCIWQEGYESVWVIPDNRKIPFIARNWNQVVFTTHTMDDLIAYKGFFCSSYQMDEPYTNEDLSKMTPEVVSRQDAHNIMLSNPFICASRLCFNVKRNGLRVVYDYSGALYPVRFDKWR